jgi:GTP diphosphokinase / guanosine-3',5'-bis(diphosphate) 3'-diphosphatase
MAEMDSAANDLGRVIEAAAFAADRHRMQRRKDAEASPYINHPLALARILSREGGIGDADILCAALLHDTVEDTGTTLEELAGKFGAAIASIVAEVTNDAGLSKAEQKRAQVANAASKSRGAKLVKLADKIANLRDIAATPPADWDAARRAEYYRWSRDVVAGLRGVSPALEQAFDEAYERGLERIGD